MGKTLSKDDKILVIDILTLLQQYTNENNPMTLKGIQDTFEKHYNKDYIVNRKTLKRNLENLTANTPFVGSKNKGTRMIKNKKTGEYEEVEVNSIYYYKQPFEESELRLIIDGILFSKYMTNEMKKDLIGRLANLTSEKFKFNKDSIEAEDGKSKVKKLLYKNISEIYKAIRDSKKISFAYNRYSVDPSFHLKEEPEKRSDGTIKEYLVNPYQMIASNGRYYLICNHDRYHNMSYYRIDRISNINIEATARKSLKKIEGYENGLEITKLIKKNIYLFSGDLIKASIRFNKKLMTEFVDWFGEDAHFSNQTSDEITATIEINNNALRKWALQYGLHFRVIEPAELVQSIKEDIEQVRRNYE